MTSYQPSKLRSLSTHYPHRGPHLYSTRTCDMTSQGAQQLHGSHCCACKMHHWCGNKQKSLSATIIRSSVLLLSKVTSFCACWCGVPCGRFDDVTARLAGSQTCRWPTMGLFCAASCGTAIRQDVDTGQTISFGRAHRADVECTRG